MNIKFGLTILLLVILVSGCIQTASVDITGPWHGTYESSKGEGKWFWIIEKSGSGYTGVLTTTEPYAGKNIPVSVTLDGNKITIGWVAAGVVFEGIVSENKMSGTWKFQNGMDSGHWQGVRGESSQFNLPKEDIAGEDLPNVPRYTPSIRTNYNKHVSGGVLFIDITYYTKDDLEKVREFYLSAMPENNWKLLKEEASPKITFYGFNVVESRTLDFRRPGCTDPERCLPYAKITIGRFEAGENYTIIELSYESAQTTKEKLTSVTPPTNFGKAFNEFMSSLLSKATGKDVMLTFYHEAENAFGVEGASMIQAEYTLSSPITDVSATAQAIKEQLAKNTSATISISGDSAEIELGTGLKIYGKLITYPSSIKIFKNSDKVEIYFFAQGD